MKLATTLLTAPRRLAPGAVHQRPLPLHGRMQARKHRNAAYITVFNLGSRPLPPSIRDHQSLPEQADLLFAIPTPRLPATPQFDYGVDDPSLLPEQPGARRHRR
uniref:Uncharacterized protein n=1 Tax=Triticum urartu TaxID=4572 RepID=A0A8R7P0V6_TRIUA